MPGTVNGIGTSYLFAKNKKEREATCEFCHHVAKLATYETGYYFTVFFIPLIPLGKRKIVDQCSVCQMHRAVPLKQWEQQKQVAIPQAMQSYRENPGTESGLNLHGTLLAFQEFEQAEPIRETLIEELPKDAELRAGLADQMASRGLDSEAVALRDQAYELDPDSPETKLGKAWNLLQDDQPEEARQLLHFLEEPDAQENYDLTPLITLANVFQEKGDHQQAMELFATLLKAYPHSAEHHAVRSAIRKSEKALGSKTSILPPIKHNLSGLFSSRYSPGFRQTVAVVVIAAVVLIGFALNNEYIRRNREILIVNHTGQPLQYSLDGQTTQTTSNTMIRLPVVEGSHDIKVLQPLAKDYAIQVTSSYFDRWTCTPVWMINVNGEALLIEDTLYYAQFPPPSTEEPVMEEVIERRHVDYPFVDSPDQLPVDENETKQRNALRLVETGNDPLTTYLLLTEAAGRPHLAFQYARRVLDRIPDDQSFVRTLVRTVPQGDAGQLFDYLWNRIQSDQAPEWLHHELTDVPANAEQNQQLIDFYEKQRTEDPENPLWIYLDGLWETDLSPRKAAMRNALERDPEMAPARAILINCLLAEHDFQQAQSEMAWFAEPSEVDTLFWPDHYLALASLDYAGPRLESWEEQPPEIASPREAAMVADILLAHDRQDLAFNLADPAQFEIGNSPLFESMHATLAELHYVLGNHQKAAELAGKVRGDHVSFSKPMVVEADTDPRANTYLPSILGQRRDLPLVYLLRSWLSDHDSDTIQRWRRNITRQFRKRGGNDQVWADLFEAPVDQSTVDRLDGLYLGLWNQPLTLTALAVLCDQPEIRTRLVERARQAQFSHLPSAHLLEQVWEKME